MKLNLNSSHHWMLYEQRERQTRIKVTTFETFLFHLLCSKSVKNTNKIIRKVSKDKKKSVIKRNNDWKIPSLLSPDLVWFNWVYLLLILMLSSRYRFFAGGLRLVFCISKKFHLFLLLLLLDKFFFYDLYHHRHHQQTTAAHHRASTHDTRNHPHKEEKRKHKKFIWT